MAKKGVINEIEGKSGTFALVFLFLFALTFGFLAVVGATPDASNTATPNTTDTLVSTPTPVGETPTAVPTNTTAPQEPVRVIIKKIGLNASISNPSSTDVDVLDQALLKGGVRYPTSGLLGVNGTVLLFGHSSYLPIVHNQAYKSFDGIQNLKDGDTISVYSSDTEYRYSVTSVKTADATNDVVELPQDAQHLALVTCDSFATKSNRFVVTADFAGAYQLAQ